MSRMFIDCREVPSTTGCSVAISADSEQELLEAAVQHAVSVHHEHDTPELREEIRKAFKPGSPPVDSPRMPSQQPQQQPMQH